MPKGFEWIIILIIVIIIFGPKALPKLGETLGTTVKNIRKGMSDDDEEESDSKDSESEIVVSEEDQEIAELEAKLAEAKAKKVANEDDDENESPISTK